MPQMMPLNWMFLFVYSSITLLIIMMIMFFYYYPNLSSMMSTKIETKTFNLKW